MKIFLDDWIFMSVSLTIILSCFIYIAKIIFDIIQIDNDIKEEENKPAEEFTTADRDAELLRIMKQVFETQQDNARRRNGQIRLKHQQN